MPPKLQKSASNRAIMAGILWTLIISFYSQTLFAQHGHPLVGTWSGSMDINNQSARVLLVLSFSVDQVISGSLTVNGRRLPLVQASMDPSDWSVKFTAKGTDRAGKPLTYEIEGVIENLGSVTERTINGTWKNATGSGKFKVVLN